MDGSSPSANLLTGLGIDEYFQRSDSSGSRSFLTDALGSSRALGDENGTVLTQYNYQPFGQTTESGNTSSNSFQYTGRENDGTGLYFYRARYYHPELRRFISEDPIGFGGGINIYSYVLDNPIDYSDPFGLWTFGGSLNFSGGAGYGGTTGINFVIDGHGNFDVQTIGGGGSYSGFSTVGSFTWEYSTADSVHELQGEGYQIGGIFPTLVGGFESGIFGGDSYTGIYGGWAIGGGVPAPAGYVFGTWTKSWLHGDCE